jgi:hypothetical protein
MISASNSRTKSTPIRVLPEFDDHHAAALVLVVASVSGVAEGFDCIVEAISKVQKSLPETD